MNILPSAEMKQVTLQFLRESCLDIPPHASHSGLTRQSMRQNVATLCTVAEAGNSSDK